MIGAEFEFGRRTDIMPSAEAQREASEVTLGWMEPLEIVDAASGASMRIRPHNFITVFVAGVDEGTGENGYVGKKAMFDGKDYPYHLKGKRVNVKPTEIEDRKRKFKVTLAEGLSFKDEKAG